MYKTLINQNDEIYVTDMNEMLTLDVLTSKELEALREECVADFVNLNDLFPETSTQGVLTSEQMSVLQENTINYILFNSEIYRLNADNQTEGYLTYSCVDYENGITMVKTITVTIATQSWVLNKVSVTDIKAVNLNESVPSSSTQGVLTDEEYDLLVLNDNNYILFNNEIYRLTTKEHLSGYMSYTCIEYENDTMTIKTITIMTMSKSWTLDDVIVNDQPFIDLTDYYTKEGVDGLIGTCLSLTGGTMTGDIVLDDYKYLKATTRSGSIKSLIHCNETDDITLGDSGTSLIVFSDVLRCTSGGDLGATNYPWDNVYCNNLYKCGETVLTKNELSANLKLTSNFDIDALFE